MTNPKPISPNSSSSPCSSLLAMTVPLVILSLLSGSIAAVDSEYDGSRGAEWQILTKLNFSSQIRLHPHILLFVTVPWSGESRTLMKELAHIVDDDKQTEFNTLKLMVVYRSNDKVLADTLGATEGLAILYYHQAMSYKYQGPLRVQNILSSVHHFMSLMPEDIPLKSLTTPEDMKTFIESTDKAFLILEFCGWTTKLLGKLKNNGTENGFESILGGFDSQTNGTFSAGGKENLKKMENEMLKSGIDDVASGNPWPGEFSATNGSDFLESENGVSCRFDEFQRFEVVFPKLMSVVKEFFLPPQKIRFGLVRDRSMLPVLGVQDSDPWFMMLYFTGCPSCSKVLKEGIDIRSALQMQASPVLELEGDDNDPVPALPTDKPSIFLFIDRSSESLEIRKKSDETLRAFREVALYHWMNDPTSANSQQYSRGVHQSPHPKLEMSPISRKITLNDKTSAVLMDKGKPVTIDKMASDLQGNSLSDILTYLLQHRKEIKISSLAKDVGFELLSDDFSVKVAEGLPSELKVQSNEVSQKLLIDDLNGNGHFSENQTPDMADSMDKGLSKSASAELSQEKVKYADLRKPSSVAPDPRYVDEVVVDTAEEKSETTLPDFQAGKHRLPFPGFRGSFFFVDGRLRLLNTLVHASKIPNVVIIDPLSQQHYVFPEDEIISYSAVSDFLDSFLNRSLLPYQRSETVIRSPKAAPRPPFINLDFHEVDSMSHVNIHTFRELVFGNQSDLTNSANAWKKDVLVLFSNGWCGFCQRMELVVREVHLAFKRYVRMLNDGIGEEKSSLPIDDMKNSILKLPLIYLMDCTQNDCSLILKSYTQRELYPSLLLFPAENKRAVPYGGDMAVSEVIDFIADHGGNSQRLFRENGILWSKASQGVRNDNLHTDVPQVAVDEEVSSVKGKYHEVVLKDRDQNTKISDDQIILRRLNSSHETAPEMVVGSLLVATDKLQNANPFDGSKILIVNANRSTGFQGLIINKHINWDSLGKLEGLELLKEAPLSLGGPVMLQEMPLVALTHKYVKDHCVGILPDIYFLDQWATLNVIEGLKNGNFSISDYWFFLGYSGWGWDQLFDEIAEGSWKVSNGDTEHIDWPWR